MAKKSDKRDTWRTGSAAGDAGPGGGAPSAPYAYRPYSPEELEADPELWWKERQRQLRMSAAWHPIVKTRRRGERDGSARDIGPIGSLSRGVEKTLGDLPNALTGVRDERDAVSASAAGGIAGASKGNGDGRESRRPAGGVMSGTSGGLSGTAGQTSGGTSLYGGGAPIAPWYNESPGSDAGRRPPGGGFDNRGLLARLRRGFVMRAAVALLLYGAAWGWLKWELPGSGDAEAWMTVAVTQDMDFSAAEAWYGRMFGDSPSFLPVFRRGAGDVEEVTAEWDGQQTVAPVQGRIAETYKQNGTGVRIEAAPGSAVSAVHSGRVIQVTLSSQGDATVLVQHAGRIVTVYGGVSATSVRADDWVEAGGKLGVLGPAADGASGSSLYFAIRLGDRSLDPQEVIPFD
ncbi:M23 family metallopeptidase [Cohnella rhizosphaerae]|uniref:M23 family metallopeptidase n=1 Tax=Cohnella rhizosphaerae TaxID=1457232 RepID=A0A9X4QXN6_9BACL|nr:M23 family metallopeptidase [Cohnella rhizosphaerae]MDG0813702.1 M23 family metallopeptidase [Cohnella rhizosphaerae]